MRGISIDYSPQFLMKNILDDCLFVSKIMSITQPEKILLLGSGETKAPLEWLKIPGIQCILFNKKNLNAQYYRSIPVFSVVCWKKTLPDCEKFYNLKNIKGRPNIIVLDDEVEEVMDLDKKLFIFNDGHRNKQKYIGSWYSNVSDELSKNSNSPRIYTTGFYMTMWLLAGPQKEIYIAGFDGYKNRTMMHHLNIECPPVPFDNKHHDYLGEWKFIEEAIRIARLRGIKVEMTQTK